MHLEEFAGGTTLLHRMDPRVKFIAAAPLLLAAALAHGARGPAFALAVGVALAFVARLDARKLLPRLLALNGFLAMVWAFVPFGYPGEPAFALGPLTASHEGLAYALAITLKSNAIVLMTIAVFGTTEVFQLAHALVHMRVPVKLVYLFFFFYRYISVLHEEYSRLRRAMRLRAFRPRTSAHTYRSIANLVGMLLVRSSERSARIYHAMLCRGFHGHFPVMRHFHLHAFDLWAGLCLIASAVPVAVLS